MEAKVIEVILRASRKVIHRRKISLDITLGKYCNCGFSSTKLLGALR
jgi:CRISPR/Cas system endoribonuclease Cas6 (RAMP superfamily)